MARITVEDCLEKIDNQYDLVLLAKERTAQLNAGAPILVDEDNDKRNEMSKIYTDLLTDIDGVVLIKTAPYCRKSSKHLFQILVDSQIRDDLLVHFYDNNIFPGVHYLDNTNYPMYNFASGQCLSAKSFSDRLVSLPLHLNLSESDIQKVVDILLDFLYKKG